MIKTVNLMTAFLAIGITVLFALTLTTSAQTPTIDNDDYIVEGYDVTVFIGSDAGVSVRVTVTGPGDLRGTITDSTGSAQSEALVSGVTKSFIGKSIATGLGTIEIFAGPIKIAFQEAIWVASPLSDNCVLPNTRDIDDNCVVLPKVAAAPAVLPPVFNTLDFAFPIEVAENLTRVGGIDNFFSASGATDYALSGINAALFTVTDSGNISFNTAPDFETPRGGGGNSNIYTFRVTATNSAGSVFKDVTVEVSNTIERPHAVTLQTGAITANSIVIDWEGVTQPAWVVLTNYEVKYNIVGDSMITTEEVSSSATTYTITGLESNSRYDIRVVANTAEGSRQSLNVLRATTLFSDPTGITLSVTPATVVESDEEEIVEIVASFTGGKFFVSRSVELKFQGGTATVGTDHEAVEDITILFPVESITETRYFDLSAYVDFVAEPSGETVNITARLLNVDGEGYDTALAAATATITINDYTTIGANAGSDQSVMVGDTITLDGTVTSATPANTIRWTHDSAATLSALQGAGVTAPNAQAEVTRLNNALALITSAGGTLTAPAIALGLTSPATLTFTITATDNAAPDGQPIVATDQVVITVKPPTATGFNLAITSPSSRSVLEDGGTQSITVTATTSPANTIFANDTTINVSVSGATGATSSANGANADFTDVAPFTITIPANIAGGAYTKTFQLIPTSDTISEGARIGLSPETITFTGTSGSLPSDTATLTIVDNDAPPTTVTLSVTPTSFREGARIKPSIVANVVGTTTYPYDLIIGVTPNQPSQPNRVTATFTPIAANAIVIPAGQSSSSTFSTQHGTVSFDNTVTQPGSGTYTAIPTLGTAISGYDFSLYDPTIAPVPFSLIDNDYTFTSTAVPSVVTGTTAVVTVAATPPSSITSNTIYSITGGTNSALFSINSSTGALVFNSAPVFTTGGSNSYQVIVTASTGNVNDPDTPGPSTTQTITASVVNANVGVTFTPASVTVTEASGTGNTATYTIVLDSEPTAPVTVQIASANENIATVSPASLTFTVADYATAQTVTVTGVDDLLDNDGRATSITHTFSGGGYDGYNSGNVVVTLTDDDADTAPSFQTFISNQAYTLGTAIASLQLPTALSGNGATTYTLSPSTLPAGLSHNMTNRTIEGTPTAVAATTTYTYTAMDQDDDVASFTFTITVNGPASVIASTNAVSINEMGVGNTATYTVRLNSTPTGSVVVTPVSSVPGRVTVSSGVTFTTSNWDIPQIITLTAVDNNIVDSDSAVNITHTVGNNYATIITPTVIVTIVDDEGAPQYDFTQNGSVGQNDGLVFYLLASGITVAATGIVIEKEAGSPLKNNPYDALDELEALIKANDSRYDFTQNGSVGQNDGLVFYLLASGITVAATGIVIEKEAGSSIKGNPYDALELLKASFP